jgi:predicted nucleic acid-binding protein
MIVVADASPVLHLARIGRLELIRAVLGEVIVPRTVWSELIQPGTRLEVVAMVRTAAWIAVVEDPELRDLGLDPGETAAILLASSLRADAILIDERRGRGVATGMGLAVIGTLGVLAGAKRAGVIALARPVIAELRTDGFWLADALAEEFLRNLGEARRQDE